MNGSASNGALGLPLHKTAVANGNGAVHSGAGKGPGEIPVQLEKVAPGCRIAVSKISAQILASLPKITEMLDYEFKDLSLLQVGDGHIPLNTVTGVESRSGMFALCAGLTSK